MLSACCELAERWLRSAEDGDAEALRALVKHVERSAHGPLLKRVFELAHDDPGIRNSAARALFRGGFWHVRMAMFVQSFVSVDGRAYGGHCGALSELKRVAVIADTGRSWFSDQGVFAHLLGTMAVREDPAARVWAPDRGPFPDFDALCEDVVRKCAPPPVDASPGQHMAHVFGECARLYNAYRLEHWDHDEFAWEFDGGLVTALCLDGAHAFIAHLGDILLYRLRAGTLTRLNQAHTLLNDGGLDHLPRPGSGQLSEESLYQWHVISNLLSRTLGAYTNGAPSPNLSTIDVHQHALWPGDRYLLCTPKLWQNVSEELLSHVLTEASIERAGEQLLAMANAIRGDNPHQDLPRVSLAIVELVSV